MSEAAHYEDGTTGGKGYKPSRLLFFVMLGVIVASLVFFILAGPLKGHSSSGGASKAAASPSTKR